MTCSKKRIRQQTAEKLEPQFLNPLEKNRQPETLNTILYPPESWRNGIWHEFVPHNLCAKSLQICSVYICVGLVDITHGMDTHIIKKKRGTGH